MSWLALFLVPASALTLNNAPLEELLKAASEVTGQTYVADADLCERFTVEWPADASLEEVRAVFFGALGIHGYAVVPKDGVMRVRSVRYSCFGEGPRVCRPQYSSLLTRLLRDPAAVESLRPRLTRDGVIEPVKGHSSFVISDDQAVLLQSR